MAEEARLTSRAVAGDGAAFATLYGRYERRVYNLCYRILGSADDAADATQEAFLGIFGRLPNLADRELHFGSYLFMCARNASYDIVKRRSSASPTDVIPDAAAPLGPGAGGDGDSDPGAPEDDPERNVLLAAQQEEIRAANATLPERQREVLALRELEGMSYDEIAEIMGMNRNSVAQLISRARIGLRDAMRSTALASVTAATPECERALPLIALGQDRQPRERAESRWLKAHLAACDSCRVSREAMAEAGVSYRAWAPIVAAPWLLHETVARAAELAGADWSEVFADHDSATGETATHGPAASGLGARLSRRLGTARAANGRRRAALAAALAALLVVIVFVGTTHDGGPVDDELAAEAPAGQAEPAADADPARRARRKAASEPQASGALAVPGLLPRASAAGKTARPPATDEPKTTTDPPPATDDTTPETTTDPPVGPPPPPTEEPPDEVPPDRDPPRGIPPVFIAPPPPPPPRCGIPGTPRCPRP